MGDSSPGEKAVTRPAVLPPLTSAALAGKYNTVTLCMYVHTSNTLLPLHSQWLAMYTALAACYVQHCEARI